MTTINLLKITISRCATMLYEKWGRSSRNWPARVGSKPP